MVFALNVRNSISAWIVMMTSRAGAGRFTAPGPFNRTLKTVK